MKNINNKSRAGFIDPVTLLFIATAAIGYQGHKEIQNLKADNTEIKKHIVSNSRDIDAIGNYVVSGETNINETAASSNGWRSKVYPSTNNLTIGNK